MSATNSSFAPRRHRGGSPKDLLDNPQSSRSSIFIWQSKIKNPVQELAGFYGLVINDHREHVYALVLFQVALAQTNGFRCYLNQFVIINEVNRIL